MAKSKTITEVMAAIFHNAIADQDENIARWEDLVPDLQARTMSGMVEVVRMLEMFGLLVCEEDGKIFLKYEPPDSKKKEKSEPRPVNISPTGLGQPEPTGEAVRSAQTMGYTGIPCDQCGSVNTVRIGKCLQCQRCFHNGECG